MTRPTARVLALLEALQSGGTRTVSDLAAQLEVDERTVRRYIEHLKDLDVPVRSVRGRYGGYRLAPGFRMPPLMLTDEEALAVLLGLTAGRRLGLAAAGATATDSAAAKLRRVLPEALGRRLDALLETADFTAPQQPAVPPEARVLLLLAEAARHRHPVAITYADRGGRPSERIVLPYGIVAHSGRWYATGADSRSGEIRSFRLDRISAPAVRQGTFEVPDDFDPAAHVVSGIAQTPWTHSVSLRIKDTAQHIRTRFPAGIATVHEMPATADGDPPWIRVRLRAERLDWVASVLASLDRPFVIEDPSGLRDLVHALARRLDACADADADADMSERRQPRSLCEDDGVSAAVVPAGQTSSASNGACSTASPCLTSWMSIP
jgi:predicted DNA-binding transcriptional regulator YafY